MDNFRQKLVIFVLIAGSILVLLQTSFPQKVRDTLFPIRHTLVDNTLSSSADLTWSYYSDNGIIVPPKGNDDLVVLLENDGHLTALGNSSGKVIWEYNIGSGIGYLWSNNVFDLDNNLLVTFERDNSLLALDVANGHTVWRASLPSLRTTPDIMIVGSVVVVSIFSTARTEGHITVYRLEDGNLLWDKRLPSRAYAHTFKCPFIAEFLGLMAHINSGTICLSLYNRLEVIDTYEESEIRVIGTINHAFPSNDTPFYQAGMVFTNPNPEPKVQFYNIAQARSYELPANCETAKAAHSVTSNGIDVLVANGCDELYILDTDSLLIRPSWVFNSDDAFVSPFVAVNRENGFVLNDQAEIVAVDLSNGEVIGKLSTTPSQLQRERLTNSLVVNPPYLYVVMDSHSLFGLQAR